MWAGTLARLEPVDGPLETDIRDQGGIDVQESYQYLDGERVQAGVVAGRVPSQREFVHIGDGEIDIKTTETDELVASEFLADVEQGWILSERTYSSDGDWLPDWPFSYFQMMTGQDVEPVTFDVGAFAERQESEGRTYSVEMATIEKEYSGDTRIQWGGADNPDGQRSNVGVALETEWGNAFPRAVVYESGYVAIWNSSGWSAEMAGRFIHEEIRPIIREREAERVDESTPEQQEVGQHD